MYINIYRCKMQIFIKINQSDTFQVNLSTFTYWLNTKTCKWLYKYIGNDILVIFNTSNYNRIDNLSNGLKRHFFQDIHTDLKQYISMQTIKNDIEFGKCLIKYFMTDIDLQSVIDTTIFKWITMNGYIKNKLLNIIISTNKEIEQSYICSYCSKQFSSIQYKNNHSNKCGLSKNNQQMMLEMNELKNENKMLKEKLKNNEQPIINITQNTNNIQISIDEIQNNIQNGQNNIQNNINLVTKKDKLNFYYKDTVDIDTFIDKYKNDPKYQLTYHEAQVLLEILELNGYIGYGNGLSSYLKDKCLLIFNDININNNNTENTQGILPFVNNDSQFRTHYEKNNTSWIVVKNDEKIKKILHAASNQLYNHHNKNPTLNSRETKSVINAILKKADISSLQLNESNTQSIIKD